MHERYIITKSHSWYFFCYMLYVIFLVLRNEKIFNVFASFQPFCAILWIEIGQLDYCHHTFYVIAFDIYFSIFIFIYIFWNVVY